MPFHEEQQFWTICQCVSQDKTKSKLSNFQQIWLIFNTYNSELIKDKSDIDFLSQPKKCNTGLSSGYLYYIYCFLISKNFHIRILYEI